MANNPNLPDSVILNAVGNLHNQVTDPNYVPQNNTNNREPVNLGRGLLELGIGVAPWLGGYIAAEKTGLLPFLRYNALTGATLLSPWRIAERRRTGNLDLALDLSQKTKGIGIRNRRILDARKIAEIYGGKLNINDPLTMTNKWGLLGIPQNRDQILTFRTNPNKGGFVNWLGRKAGIFPEFNQPASRPPVTPPAATPQAPAQVVAPEAAQVQPTIINQPVSPATTITPQEGAAAVRFKNTNQAALNAQVVANARRTAGTNFLRSGIGRGILGVTPIGLGIEMALGAQTAGGGLTTQEIERRRVSEEREILQNFNTQVLDVMRMPTDERMYQRALSITRGDKEAARIITDEAKRNIRLRGQTAIGVDRNRAVFRPAPAR